MSVSNQKSRASSAGPSANLRCRAVNLRCEYRDNPLGLDVLRPRLSWQIDDPRRGARQTAYQVCVATDERLLAGGRPDVWDSGVVRCEQSIHVAYAGPALESSARYVWTVRIWDQNGQPSGFAAPAWWEMGLLQASDWQARWISTPAENPRGQHDPQRLPCRSQYMRRQFMARHDVVQARVYATGLGCYELWMNGARVGQDLFTPEWTLYDRRIQYQTYDVTALLRRGLNAVGAVLGNGWWAGGLSLGRGQIERTSAGNLRLLLQLRLDYADGTTETVASDDAWRAHPSPIVENTFYHGETQDARLELPGWDRPGLDDTDWSPVVVLPDRIDHLVAQSAHTIRVTQELAPRSVTQPSPGKYIFDFGQNHAGRCRLKVHGPRGTRVQLRFAEVLNPDGTLDTRNLVGARSTDEYILAGEGEEVWEPRFTYRGYRYVELTGHPDRPSLDTLVSQVLHSALPMTGEFACSNELLNQIQHNIVWAQRSNLHSVPTDCPQRDERLGWLGDAHVFAPTGCWNMDMASLFTKWLRDIRDSQGSDGHVPDVAPAAVVHGPAAPGWGDAIAGVPWTLFQFYGDLRVIEENYAALRAWVEYMRAHAPHHLYECPHARQVNGYGDWIAPVESPRAPIASAFYYYSTQLLARMARIIGREGYAAEYANLAQQIRAAFHGAFFDEQTNNYLGAAQTANILPLAFGLTPPERRAAVLANLVRDIEARQTHLSTGFIGTAYVLPLLSQNGYHELAYGLATQRTYPSWGYMIDCGATTMCELWNPDTGDPRMNSWNHFALGSIGQWFYECLAGVNVDTPVLRPGAPVRQRFTIRPRPVGDLTWARASFESLSGTLRCYWQRDSDQLRLEAAIPPNTTACLCIPTLGWHSALISEGGTKLVQSGTVVGRADELEFERIDDEGYAVFIAGAGRYVFTVRPQ
jgi:alpha-L-rhamnosidase